MIKNPNRPAEQPNLDEPCPAAHGGPTYEPALAAGVTHLYFAEQREPVVVHNQQPRSDNNPPGNMFTDIPPKDLECW